MVVIIGMHVPLLDRGIVEVAWRVSTNFKNRDGRRKWLLLQDLSRYAPQKLMDRLKMSFRGPINILAARIFPGWGGGVSSRVCGAIATHLMGLERVVNARAGMGWVFSSSSG